MRKYDAIDEKLLEWLRRNPEGATTSAAIASLNIQDSTTQRHISRRFTLLEDRGALVCELQGTTRICRVELDKLPEYMHRGGPNNRTWRTRIREDATKPAPASSIPATTSDEFLAAGGKIERIPCNWDKPPSRKQVGPLTFLDLISELD